MRRWFPRLLLLTFAFQATIYGARPMVSYRALDIGAGPLMVGVVASSYAVLSLVMAVAIGRWVDRWGEARFMGLGACLLAGTSLWLVWIDSLWMLVLNQAIMGLGHIMTLLSCQTLIANAMSGLRRDAGFGGFLVVQSLGQLVGPAAAGLLAGGLSVSAAPVDGGVVFAAAAGASVVALLVAGSLQRYPDGSRADVGAARSVDARRMVPAVRRVLRIPGMQPAMLASLTVVVSIDVLAAYLPLYGEATGLSVQVVGLLLSTRAAASVVSRLLMVRLIRAVGRRWLLIGSMVLPALALATLPLQSRPLLFGGMVVIGFGLGLGQPITLSWVTGRADPKTRGTAAGVRLTGNRLGQLILPAGVGAAAGAAGVAAIFPALGLLLLASAGFVVTAPLNDAPVGEDGAGA